MTVGHVTVTQGFVLKSAGFDDPVNYFHVVYKTADGEQTHLAFGGHGYGNNWNNADKLKCSAPSKMQVIDWFARVKKIYIQMILSDINKPERGWTHTITREIAGEVYTKYSDERELDYYKALEKAIDEALNLI